MTVVPRVVLVDSRRWGDLYFIGPSTKSGSGAFPTRWGANKEIALVGRRSKSNIIHNSG